MKKKIIAAVTLAAMLIPSLYALADYKENDLKTAVTKAITWKDTEDSPFYSIGSNSSNLYIVALNRLGRNYDYKSYLAGMDGVAAAYGYEHNASDMQRGALAVISAGGDAENVGGRDLIADSTYFRDATAPLDAEGADGYSWALITLDSLGYSVPEWGIKNRDKIIAGLLSHQRTDGSFDGTVYSTASAVAALAPYIEGSGAYTVTRLETGETLDVSPGEASAAAVQYLSDNQTKDGDWGNLIDTAMTVIAIDSIGMNAESNSLFVARNGNAIDGLMSYQNKDGGFSNGGKVSEGEATSYALCALTSHLRYLQGKSTLFNVKARDTVSLDTATSTPTATPVSNSSSSSTNRSTSSSSSSSSSSRVTPTPRAAATPRTSTSSRATATPKAAAKSTATPNPLATSVPTPTATPKPTRRPDLVGPVLMPGPMPAVTPTPEPEKALSGKDGAEIEKRSAAPVVTVIIAIIVLAVLAALIYLVKSGKLTRKSVSKTLKGRYKAKRHRKTEEHRRYEQREKYRIRRKYKR